MLVNRIVTENKLSIGKHSVRFRFVSRNNSQKRTGNEGQTHRKNKTKHCGSDLTAPY